MESGFSKRCSILLFFLCGFSAVWCQYQVSVSPLTHNLKDLSQRTSTIYDQNGERCALIKFETPIPNLISFNLGAQQIEKRENKDDEVWIWVSEDVKKLTVLCTDCTPLKDYRVSLKSGNVYTAKITTGLPQETATTQNVNITCYQIPFMISFNGAAPEECLSSTFHTELPIGVHELTIASKFYKPYSGTIRVSRSRPYSDTIRLEDNYGEVYINASPAGYEVSVDGEKQNQTRVLILEPGQHKISIAKERYVVYETPVNVEVGRKYLISTELIPAFSTFTITATEDETEIWVDGKNQGHMKVNVELVWGEHTIEGRREGYDTWVYSTKDFTESSIRTIRIPKLNKLYGAVRLSFYPTNALAYLDGKMISNESGTYTDNKVPVGLHYVQVMLPDYTSARDSFTIASGEIFTNNYVLKPKALGTITINTDPEIGIYRVLSNGKLDFLGHSSFRGKIPAGENIIQLKNASGITCQYHLFVNNKEDRTPIDYHFYRNLMIRTNVGRDITLKGERLPEYTVKTDKWIKLDPVKYEITVKKRGYMPYYDTIDLSKPDVQSLIYRADLHKLSDTISTVKHSNRFLQQFYNRAGTWYVGIIDFGYTFDFNGGPDKETGRQYRHMVNLGILPWRYKMFGMSPADIEICANDSSIVQSLCYKPRLSLFVPCSSGFAFHFYGGLTINLYDAFINSEKPKVRMCALGGIAMRFNYVGRFPMDIFAEYKYPVSGYEDLTRIGAREQLFRVGILFSAGIDH